MTEWTPYKISISKAGQFGASYGVPFDEVHHVVHVPAARRILEDGYLRAGLIYDESRLNKSRTSVTWLSANTWANGSIYGNIQFTFSWLEIIKDKRFYWVEAMTGYSPAAFRILITDRDLDHSKYVVPYDPGSSQGPLREHKGVWYRNGNFTSEFMIDGDLDLQDCISFEFVRHHDVICRANGGSCKDRQAATYRTGGKIIAFLLGNDLHCLDDVLKAKADCVAGRKLSYAIDEGITGIHLALANKADSFGGVIRNADAAKAILCGSLALYGADQKKAAVNLINLMKTSAVFENALEALVNSHFRMSGWTLPD